MQKVLLSAFSCNPYEGSESLFGWNWSNGLVKEGFEVHTLTREISKSDIEKHTKIENLYFHFIRLPFGLERLYSFSQPTMYLYYFIWQWFAFLEAKKLQKYHKFHRIHHVSWGSLQQGSFLYKINVPFIYGPAGGGQKAPVVFKKYFAAGWSSEVKREKISAFLIKFNPACKKMLKKASAVLVSNPDSFELVKSVGSKVVFNTLDAALPSDFFPNNFKPKVTLEGSLKLLWIGRLMPRKGVLLVLEVMEKLKSYPGITLTIVGDGEQRELLKEGIERLGLQNTVFWKGKVPFEEVKNYYAQNDVFFFTSLRDSGPSQLIEAMAYGLPVVTLNLHGQAVIVNNQTGIRCSIEQPDRTIAELEQGILSLYNNPKLVYNMSQNAHNFALDQTWDKKISKIVSEFYVN